jgi:AraC-like DNA-binding protein
VETLSLTTGPPLNGFEAFRARTGDELAHAIETNLGGRVVRALTGTSFDTRANRYRLTTSELWYCAYGFPIRIQFSAGDYFRVQFPHSGKAVTHLERRAISVGDVRGCISDASATIDFDSDFQQVAWRIARDELLRKLATLTGRACRRDLTFDAALDFSAGPTRMLSSILRSLLDSITPATGAGYPMILVELEQALIIALLCGSGHSYRTLLDGAVSPSAKWQVRRIEEYIEAHCLEPIRIEDLVELTGTSARSIYRAFRESRGYSPMQFAKLRRLERARRLLLESSPGQSVTSIALACGFTELSHFTRAFSQTFGEPPSAILARRERMG